MDAPMDWAMAVDVMKVEAASAMAKGFTEFLL
jgi:hypothetical protein